MACQTCRSALMTCAYIDQIFYFNLRFKLREMCTHAEIMISSPMQVIGEREKNKI